MIKRIFTIRKVLAVLLLVSVAYAAYSIDYKINKWGFDFHSSKVTDVWTIEANISFDPTGEPVDITLSVPQDTQHIKILDENIVAPNYKIKKFTNGNRKISINGKADGDNRQNIYYSVMLYDNEDSKGKEKAPAPATPKKPIFDEHKTHMAEEILNLATQEEGDNIQQIIHVLNKNPIEPAAGEFLNFKTGPKTISQAIIDLLAMKKIPARIVRGIRLEEGKTSASADIMVEVYTGSNWRVYNIDTGEKGIPHNFVVFQRGGDSLFDVSGGENSAIKFSVLQSATSSFNMAPQRAKSSGDQNRFAYSIYNLPLLQQNTIKWLTIFPLAILIVVILRNVIGLKTMGTFTPMLLAMSLVKTGLVTGLVCFSLIIALGLILRVLLSHFNLLLVPRISAVVIFVILIIQMMTIFGHNFDLEKISAATFFPIIITAWIIERASITWEEDGAWNALHEIIFTVIVALITYVIVASDYVRHIMFIFNELNFVILIIVMLLGTYTGYRLTELKRFSPIAKRK